MEPPVLFVAPRLDAEGAEIYLACVVPQLRPAGLDVSFHDRSSSNSSRSVRSRQTGARKRGRPRGCRHEYGFQHPSQLST
jgi:hypothetical protein